MENLTKEERIGKLIKQHRKVAGINQTLLAKKADVAVPTISLLEAGKHKGRMTTYKKIAKFLNIPENMILDILNEDVAKPNESEEMNIPTSNNLLFPIGMKIGDHHVEIDPSLKQDIRRYFYWSIKTGILTRKDIDDLFSEK